MLFNYDLIEIVFFVVSGIVLCSKTLYIPTTLDATQVNESLVSAIPSRVSSNAPYLPKSLKTFSDSGVQTVDTLASGQVDAGIQTANTYVNAGIQTSSRMWLQSVRNWINEILGSHSAPQYRDVGVQTGTNSLWDLFKQSVSKFLNINTSSSSITTPNNVKVDTWMSRLNSNQSVDIHDSESSLTTFRFSNDDHLHNLVEPDDSLSQVGAHIDPTNIPLPDSPIHDGVIYQVWDKVGMYGPNYLFCTNDVGQFTNPEYINTFLSPYI